MLLTHWHSFPFYFFIVLFLYSTCRASPPLFPTGFFSLFMLLFKSFFFLFLCLLYAFACFLPFQQKRIQAKIKKQMGSNNIPSLLHCFLRGSMPHVTEQSNWHHSNSLGCLTRMLCCSGNHS